jgi:hypothetical protein
MNAGFLYLVWFALHSLEAKQSAEICESRPRREKRGKDGAPSLVVGEEFKRRMGHPAFLFLARQIK